MWATLGTAFFNIFTGGSLNRILDTIDRYLGTDPTTEQLKADVTKTWIQAQANLLVGRTWWFQLLFVIPLGMWWTGVVLDSMHLWPLQHIEKLPTPLDTWAGWIISALFLVDGGKAVIGRFKK